MWALTERVLPGTTDRADVVVDSREEGCGLLIARVRELYREGWRPLQVVGGYACLRRGRVERHLAVMRAS